MSTIPTVRDETANGEQAARLIDTLWQEIDAQRRDLYRPIDIKSLPSIQTILELPRDQQVPIVLEAIARQTEQMRQLGSRGVSVINEFSMNHYQAFKELISVFPPKNLPLRIEDIDRLVQATSGGKGYYSWQLSLGGILRAVENFCRE